MEKIPDIYLEGFKEAQALLIKARVRLFCLLSIGIYFLGTILSYAVTPSAFNVGEIPLWGILLGSAALVLFFNRKVTKMRQAKVNAYFFTVMVVVFTVQLCILYYEYVEHSASVFLFLLFLVSFTIPWAPKEIIPIACLHVFAYSFQFFYIYQYKITGLESVVSVGEFFDSMLFIFMGFVLCYIVRKKEWEREIENFVLLKDVEGKNEQMRRELELATRVHKTLIQHSMSTDMVDRRFWSIGFILSLRVLRVRVRIQEFY